MDALNFRPMLISDIDSIMSIETTIYSHPWTKGIFADCIKIGYLCFIAERDQQIYGYGAMSTGAGECHILNISVPKHLQGKGIGKQLLQHMLFQAKQQKVEMALLEVRESNQQAINLYENQGFNEIGVRKGYYPAAKGKEDAIMFAKQL